eukprot:COSAG06_NODE_3685_length_5014_cov_4.732452_3_plen_90_part_00
MLVRKPGMAPLQLVPRKYGTDMDKAVELVCPAGTICVFTNYTCVVTDVLQITTAGDLHRQYWPGSENVVTDTLNPCRQSRLTAAGFTPT